MINVAVLGNDARFKYVKDYFKLNQFNVVEIINDSLNNIETSNKEIKYNDNNIKSIASSINYCILPVPITRDNIFISTTNISINTLINSLSSNCLVYGGLVNENFYEKCHEKGIVCIDYMKYEDVVKNNAVLTAKGMLLEVNNNTEIKGKNALVAGFGYCGKELAKYLNISSCNVDIVVRRKEVIVELEEFGYNGFMFKDEIDYKKYNLVFNTVPSLIFDSSTIKQLSSDVKIFDIATLPGGVDFKYCKTYNIFAKNYPGIPGRFYPKEAGIIIATAIHRRLIS